MLMLLIVQSLKVHPGITAADVNDCIDDVGTLWCWFGGCQWLYRWCKYTIVLLLVMSLVIYMARVHVPAVGVTDVSGCRECIV